MSSTQRQEASGAEIVISDEDEVYEEDVLRNRYSLKSWWRYLEFKQEAPALTRYSVYERALRELPGSYKLWWHYLRERIQHVRGNCVGDPLYEDVNNTFERALVFMHKMPRIWTDYLQFIMEQSKVTHARRTLDRALRSLPITQHERIWNTYLRWVQRIGCPLATRLAFRRYLRLEPQRMEDYVDYLIALGKRQAAGELDEGDASTSRGGGTHALDEAATLLARALNDETFLSQKGRSRHELWLQLCELCSHYPQHVSSLRVDAIIRSGLAKFTDEVGRLWTSLADFYIRLGNFEKARDVFEEAINSVLTVRDFALVWDAYTQFEDGVIAAKAEAIEASEASEASEGAGKGESSGGDSTLSASEELELRIARFEALVERHELLVSSVLLRQNPHNVAEWLRRVRLYEERGDAHAVIETYTLALKTVEPRKARGKPHQLWVSFARFYEAHGDLDNARELLRLAAAKDYTSVDDLASLYCEAAELELRHSLPEAALRILHEATAPPRTRHAVIAPPSNEAAGQDVLTGAAAGAATGGGGGGGKGVQARLYKSTKLWAFLADLEESVGTFARARAVYEQILELRIATPQLVLNYASLLDEHSHFEAAFQAYEKGVALFSWPHVRAIWLRYLERFVARYGGSKLERARDLFEQALEHCPAALATPFYLLYARLEERYGLARHAMAVYERATRHVADEHKPRIYQLYIRRAAEFFGVTRTREIFAHAITALPEQHVREFCMQFAELERKLGEIDRARAVLTHCAQYCEPRADAAFWAHWHAFEVRHGNEDTFREMLRVKRSVHALFNVAVNVAASTMTPGASAAKRPLDEMEKLDAAAGASPPAKRLRPQSFGDVEAVGAVAEANPDEISLDDGEDAEPLQLEQRPVPASVFGLGDR